MIDIDLSPERLYSSSHSEARSDEIAPERPETGPMPSWRMRVYTGAALGWRMLGGAGILETLRRRIRQRP